MPASIEKTYSDALFSLVQEKSLEKSGGQSEDKTVFDLVLSELETIDDVVSSLPEFVKALNTPTVSGDEKLALIEKAFKPSLSEYSYNFLRLLTTKRRMSYFSRIYRCFRASYNEKFAIAEITVTTSIPLAEALKEKILKRMTEITGKTVLIREKVDKTIIGGIMIDYGNTRLDGSVRTRLSDLKKDISNIIA